MFIDKIRRKKDASIRISCPENYLLYGVKIRKLPIAKYIQVMRTLSDLPAELISKAFPEFNNISEILNYLNGLGQDKLAGVIMRLMSIVPEHACRILSKLLDLPEDRLLNPDAEDALSLNELTQVLIAFWKMNDLSDFFATVRRLMEKPSAQNTGSNAGLPLDKVSA